MWRARIRESFVRGPLRRCWGAVLALAVVLGCDASRARSRLNAGVDRALGEAAKKRPFSGVLLVALGDEIVVRRSAGLADRARGTPITEASRFVIGSLSKQMTAALVLEQVEHGRIRLDDPIGKYLPLAVPWADTVHVRHLLDHTSGVVALDAPLAHEPGASFEYSNLGYDLLGRIVERISERSFTASAARLFARCGMATADGPRVVGYDEATSGAWKAIAAPGEVAEHPASGGLIASADDLVLWSRCLQFGRAVSMDSYRQMTAPSTTRTHRWGRLGYGFGLQILDSDGLLELSHSGYVPGFVSTLLVYPRRCVTVVVLENLSTPASDTSRAFAPHDAIRSAIREYLREVPPARFGCRE